MNKKIQILLGIPKSIYINFKYFKFRDAIKLPILVSYRTKFAKLEGEIKIKNCKIKTGLLQIGFDGAGTSRFDKNILEFNGNLIINGKASFGGGSKICTSNKNAVLTLGKNFNCTGNCHIVCKKAIIIQDDVRISWDVEIINSDFHPIYDKDEKEINLDKEIIIGKNVWICSRSIILKGSNIPNNSIIGAGTIYSRDISQENCIIAGIPNRIVKENVIH